MIKISPSIMAADFSNLQAQIEALESAGANMLHLDIMDGNYVPNITFGLDIVATIRRLTKLPLDVHLMVLHPESWLGRFHQLGVDYISFHQDALADSSDEALADLLQRSKEMQLAVALNPGQLVPAPILADFSLVKMLLVMCVWPGKGGQKFIREQLGTIETIRQQIDSYATDKPMLAVDGGINDHTSSKCIAAGADILVSGSYLFKGDFRANITSLRG